MSIIIHAITSPAYSVELYPEITQPSTLLIPEEIWDQFNARLKELSMDKKEYLSFLIRTLRTFVYLGNVNHREHSRLEFQERGLNLKKISLRPNDSDWTELRNMAGFCGMSICKFFVELVLLDFKGVTSYMTKTGASVELPTVFCGYGLEFAQNMVYFEDRSEIQRVIRIQRPNYHEGIILEERRRKRSASK